LSSFNKGFKTSFLGWVWIQAGVRTEALGPVPPRARNKKPPHPPPPPKKKSWKRKTKSKGKGKEVASAAPKPKRNDRFLPIGDAKYT